MKRVPHLVNFLVALSVSGCSNDPADQSEQPDAAVVANACGGTGNRFIFTGALEADHYDFGFVTVSGKIVGTAGSTHTGDVVAFNVRDFMFNLETLGDHDVATQKITALWSPFGASCDTGNTVCTGFYANAGTYTVLSVHPRYHATFTLSDLQERVDNFGPPGAAIPGAITGCIDKENP